MRLIFFLFRETATCYDYVEVHDGPTIHNSSLGKFCGKLQPFSVFSTTNVMLVRFVSDRSVNNKGFQLNFQAKCEYNSKNTCKTYFRLITLIERISTISCTSVSQCVNELISHSISHSVSQWVSGCQWVKQSASGWVSESVSQSVSWSTSQSVCESISQSEWVKEWVSRSVESVSQSVSLFVCVSVHFSLSLFFLSVCFCLFFGSINWLDYVHWPR